MPETATELITGGVAPWTCGSNVEYQKCQVRLQMEKEKIFRQAALTMPMEKILIVCDRGVMDNKAYMNDLEFMEVLRDASATEVELRDNYDAVFHMTTAAKGALKAYTLSNNAARTETPEQAAALDDKLIAAWTGHPHLRIIDNSTDFETKLKRVVAEIASFLGEPEPMEIERKFLIRKPDLAWLESQPNCRRVEIIQTYLNAPQGEEVRVRQRGIDGSYVYYKTTKRFVTGVRRVETETRLTRDEYVTLLMEADMTRRQIRKTRYCLTYDSQYFEIDIYPFWQDKAILEIELSHEDAPIHFPPEIGLIREVTEDARYKNASLASIASPIPEPAEEAAAPQKPQEPKQEETSQKEILTGEIRDEALLEKLRTARFHSPDLKDALHSMDLQAMPEDAWSPPMELDRLTLRYNTATAFCEVGECGYVPADGGCPDWEDFGASPVSLEEMAEKLRRDIPRLNNQLEITRYQETAETLSRAAEALKTIRDSGWEIIPRLFEGTKPKALLRSVGGSTLFCLEDNKQVEVCLVTRERLEGLVALCRKRNPFADGDGLLPVYDWEWAPAGEEGLCLLFLLLGEGRRMDRSEGFKGSCFSLMVRNIKALAMETAQGLSTLHRMGYVHGDICPENLFIQGDVWFLGGFASIHVPEDAQSAQDQDIQAWGNSVYEIGQKQELFHYRNLQNLIQNASRQNYKWSYHSVSKILEDLAEVFG